MPLGEELNAAAQGPIQVQTRDRNLELEFTGAFTCLCLLFILKIRYVAAGTVTTEKVQQDHIKTIIFLQVLVAY